MSVVMIYGFTGTYEGPTDYDWQHPAGGATHKCMLFLHQPGDSDAYQDALTECQRYGFGSVQFSACGKLQIDVLNTDSYRGFSGFYEEALAHGSALVFYPNEAAH